MRRLAILLALLLWAQPAYAQFTLIAQDVVLCGAAESCQIDNAVDANAGDLIVLTLARRSNCSTANMDALTMSDATNGAYTINAANRLCEEAASGVGSAIGYFIGSADANLTPTASWTGQGNDTAYMNVSVWRPTGTVTADQFNEAEITVSDTSHSHGSITTTGVGLIITTSAMSGDTTPTANASFTALSNNIGGGGRDFHQYWITTGAQTTTGTYTTSGAVIHSGAIASFKDTVAAGGGSGHAPIVGGGIF
jgi:hypothetical protein